MGLRGKIVFRILGIVTALIGAAMLPSLLVSLIYGEIHMVISFLVVLVPVFVLAAFVLFRTREAEVSLRIRECFLVVTFSWVIASIVGAMPYLSSGVLTNLADAFFESTSGFTTTGATVIFDVESLPKGLLFWRSFSQWLGGMGILIFAISLLPMLGIGGQLMAKIETPGPSLNKVVPRMSDTAKILYLIYLLFTLCEIALLLFSGISLFDATIAAFGSVSAGGLSNYNDGIGHFGNPYIEIVTAFFSVCVCINFTLYYSMLRGKWNDFFKNAELRAFVGILLLSFLLVSGNLWFTGTFQSITECMRYGLFQVSSFLTTTGHYNTDFNVWPTFSKSILFLLMMIGACSVSTGGGIKVIRVLILFKHIGRGFYRKLHPRAVVAIKLQKKPIPTESVLGILSFFYLYLFVFFGSSLVLSFQNLDLATTLVATAAILNNVGTGFDLIGPAGLFVVFSTPLKIFLCFIMLMGRLELFTILVLFTRAFWNPDR